MAGKVPLTKMNVVKKHRTKFLDMVHFQARHDAMFQVKGSWKIHGFPDSQFL